MVPGHKQQQEHLLALLRQIRQEAGLRQVDLAQRLGQPQSFVSKYGSGERRLDILELLQVCEAVGVTLSDFIHRFESLLYES
ncbi:MAG: helix-turn-helix domain-containing protein [Anaerolineae bacterium]|nr:helix-turn-helix domain-containing protein [Anaerolineae bacterium]